MVNSSTNVTTLIKTFQEALIAFIPIFERSNIEWKNFETYDDWDVVAETLYKVIVINPILSECKVDINHFHPFSEFEFHYDSYINSSFIRIENITGFQLTSFYGFETRIKPMDYAKFAVLNKNLETEEYISMPFFECHFTIVLNKLQKLSELIEIDSNEFSRYPMILENNINRFQEHKGKSKPSLEELELIKKVWGK